MYSTEEIGKLTRSYLERSVLSRRRRHGPRIWTLLSITAVIVLTLGLHFHKISSNRPVQTTQMALVRPQDLRKCAYVFYATNDGYACSALVNMMRLRRLGEGLPPHTDLSSLLLQMTFPQPSVTLRSRKLVLKYITRVLFNPKWPHPWANSPIFTPKARINF